MIWPHVMLEIISNLYYNKTHERDEMEENTTKWNEKEEEKKQLRNSRCSDESARTHFSRTSQMFLRVLPFAINIKRFFSPLPYL